MSTSGRPVPSSLMADTTLADLEKAWQERIREAQSLEAQGQRLIALSLRLYALEIRLKTLICKRLDLDYLPTVCKTHDISVLIIFTGLWRMLNDPANVAVQQNWDILVGFATSKSPVSLNNLRYLPDANLSAAEHKKYNDALDDPNDGVMSWLSKLP